MLQLEQWKREGNRYDRRLALIAMICIGWVGVFFTGIKPLVLSTYKEQLGVGNDIAGYLVAIETGGNCLGALLVAAQIKRWNPRRTGIVALILVFSGNALSFALNAFETLAPVRILVGVGEGLAIGVMSSSLSGTAKPDRNFAVYTSTALLVQTAGFIVIPSLVRLLGVRGIFAVLIMAIVPAAVLCRFLPSVAPDVAKCKEVSGRGRNVRGRDALLVILGSAVAYLGIGGFSPFMAEVARESGLHGQSRATALALAQFCGFVGAIVATWQNLRFGRTRPAICGLVIMVMSIGAILVEPHSELMFTFAISSFLFAWLYFFAYLAGLAAAIDRQGPTATLIFTTTSLGFAVGPALDGWLAKRTGGYVAVEILTILLLGLSIGLIAPVARRHDAEPTVSGISVSSPR